MSTGKLAYFFEASDLAHVFADWPAEIGLVLCLDAAGLCESLLFHKSERGRMPAKATAVLNCARGDLEIVPEVEGYATRRMMFTDEQKLLSLISDEDDLAELAQDYLINHRFEKSRKSAAPQPAPVPKIAALTEAFRWKPRLHLSEAPPRQAPKPDLPEGFAPRDAASECDFAEGVLEVGRHGLRLNFAPDLQTIRTPVRRAAQIGFRDDFSCFVLPRHVVTGWGPGEALVIDMPEAGFPKALRQRYAQGPRHAQVTVTGQGVFVTPGALLPPPTPEAKPRRRGLFAPVLSALIGLIFVGFAAGALLRDVDLPQFSVRPAVLSTDPQPVTTGARPVDVRPSDTRFAAR